jgi:hypothetical protein
MSSSEENKAAVRACFENASQGNFDALDDIVTGDYVLHPKRSAGQTASRPWCRAIAMPSAA